MERAVRMLIEWGFKEQRLTPSSGSPTRQLAVMAAGLEARFTYEGVLPHWLSQRGKLVDGWVGILRRGEQMLPRAPWLESPTLVGTSAGPAQARGARPARIVETRADRDTQHWLQNVRESAPHTMESDADFVVERLEDAAAGRAVHWAVTDERTDMYVGQVSLFGLQHRREAEMGFWAHPHWRRRGWSTEAARLVVKHAYIPCEDGGLGLRRPPPTRVPPTRARCASSSAPASPGRPHPSQHPARRREVDGHPHLRPADRGPRPQHVVIGQPLTGMSWCRPAGFATGVSETDAV